MPPSKKSDESEKKWTLRMRVAAFVLGSFLTLAGAIDQYIPDPPNQDRDESFLMVTGTGLMALGAKGKKSKESEKEDKK